jgi:hypothetical protein
LLDMILLLRWLQIILIACEHVHYFFFPLRVSLRTPFSQEIPIFPRENELISLGKIKIFWENRVPKLDFNKLINRYCIVVIDRICTAAHTFLR